MFFDDVRSAVRSVSRAKALTAVLLVSLGIGTGANAAGERQFDEKGWEAAIQTVLSACKEFNVACGYPANANDIEMRIKQGFSVFVMQWGEGGFKAIDAGRKASNRVTN